ncbi:hypothetical protein ACFX1X_013304 [Malus domestica]
MEMENPANFSYMGRNFSDLSNGDNSFAFSEFVVVLEVGSTEARKQATMEIRLLAKNKLKNRLKITRNGMIKPLISLLLSSDL